MFSRSFLSIASDATSCLSLAASSAALAPLIAPASRVNTRLDNDTLAFSTGYAASIAAGRHDANTSAINAAKATMIHAPLVFVFTAGESLS
jgi:hypothetical protein